MVLVRVLERRDAASLVVAIAAGLVIFSFVTSVTAHLTAVISGIDTDESFRTAYWQPIVAMVLQLVALELLARLVIAVRPTIDKR